MVDHLSITVHVVRMSVDIHVESALIVLRAHGKALLVRIARQTQRTGNPEKKKNEKCEWEAHRFTYLFFSRRLILLVVLEVLPNARLFQKSLQWYSPRRWIGLMECKGLRWILVVLATIKRQSVKKQSPLPIFYLLLANLEIYPAASQPPTACTPLHKCQLLRVWMKTTLWKK